MIRTLIDELIDAGYDNISLCKDKRFKLNNNIIEQHSIEKQNLKESLLSQLEQSDVAWLIAPETEGCLYSLAKVFVENGKTFIGSSPAAIKLTSSKLLTYRCLLESNINAVETQPLGGIIPDSASGWIIKPDDGAGGENCLLIKDRNELNKVNAKSEGSLMLVQPYIEGEVMSMSLLVFNEDVRLLACNKQYVDVNEAGVSLRAIGVNEGLPYKDIMMGLAKKIVRKITGLAGYIGVDIIVMKDELYVLEINPRFTTAYVGLSNSLGCNITANILETFLNKKLPEIDLLRAKPVRVNIA